MIPIDWVERIFQKMTVRYGRDFIHRYEGVPLAEVKEDWAKVLGGFNGWASAIAYGLENLPPAKPPTAEEFRAICRKAPQTQKALPAPEIPADMERMKSVAQSASKRAAVSEEDWAKKPKSAIAFAFVLDLAKRGERDFQKILDDLRQAGHVAGDKLVNRWDGLSWVKV